MKSNFPFVVQSFIALAIAGVHAAASVTPWYPSAWVGSLVGIVVGWAVAGFSYGVFAGKKAVQESKNQWKDNSRTQPGAASPADKATGYWIWTGAMVLIAVVLPWAYRILE